MRILHCLHAFPPHSLGGTEIYTSHVVRSLSKRDQVSLFFRVKDPGLPEFFIIREEMGRVRARGINRTVSESFSLHSTIHSGEVEKAFFDLISSFRPGIVHFHHLSGLSFRLPLIAREAGAPVVFTLHDYHLLCPRGQLLDRYLKICPGPSPERCSECLPHLGSLPPAPPFPLSQLLTGLHPIFKGIRRFVPASPSRSIERVGRYLEMRDRAVADLVSATDLFISPSIFLIKRYRESNHWKGAKFAHLKHGIPLRRERRGSGGGRRGRSPLFLYAGAIIPSKGVHLLIDAIREGRMRGLKAEFIIAGPIPGYPSFPEYGKTLTRKSNMEGVRLLPPLPHHRLLDLMQVAGCTILPSLWWENSPLVILESLSLRTPVICTRVGGIPEIVEEGKDGLLCEPGSIHSLVDKLLLMDDPGIREGLARTLSLPLPLSEHIRGLKGIYREVGGD